MSENKLENTLEALIDAATVDRILETLENVCYLKADHIAENWQDNNLAGSWKKVGAKIGQAAKTAKTEGL